MASRSVLVINSGSSSIKYGLYKVAAASACVLKGSLEGIGASESVLSHENLRNSEKIKQRVGEMKDHESGFQKVTELLRGENVYAVGHRVVHGAEKLNRAVRITEEVKEIIQSASSLAPLHNRANLQGIEVAEKLFDCPQVAVFDTAFHSTIPPYAYLYGLPMNLYKELGIRRYGFHGTSYQFVLNKAAEALGKPKNEVNIIVCHIGAGASMCAIKQGVSIDTTMGVTPLEGLVMATRSGDVDPSLWRLLHTQKGLDFEQIEKLLNKSSGLKGLCGEEDMKAVLDAAAAGSNKHRLALDVYVHRIRKYLGAYLVHLEGKVDAIVFTAGIGERSAKFRALVCQNLEAFGIAVDEQRNLSTSREIHKDGSRVKLLVIPTDEELCIAMQTVETLQSHQAQEATLYSAL